jgi:hypothetical protein
MTEPIKWHEAENNNEFLTFENVDKMMKSYNPTEFRQQYLNEPDPSEPPCISSEAFDKAKETWMTRTDECRRGKTREIFNVLFDKSLDYAYQLSKQSRVKNHD